MRARYILLLSILFCCVSCLKEDKTSTSPQAAITSFTVGYYNVWQHDINIHGRDTLVSVREHGSMYPMTISQTEYRIYNIDSLAFGSDVSRVTTSVYGTGNISYFYSDEPESVYSWSAYDSVDFTRKVFFNVVSTDKSYTRTYEVNLNVRKVFPDSLIWSEPDTAGFPVMTGISPVVRNDTVYCFGTDTTGVLSVSFRSVVGGAWNGLNAMSGLPAGGLNGVTVSNGMFYAVAGGALYGSSDGLAWSSVRTGVKSLVVCAEDFGEIWAIGSDSNIVMASDTGAWTTVQRVPAHFPDSSAFMFRYPLVTNTSLSRYVLAGLSDDSLYASVWTKLSTDSVWTRIDAPARTELRLPAADGLSAIRYDGVLFCMGKGLGGFRQSNDNGVTWYRCTSYAEDYSSWNKYMQLPDELSDTEPVFKGVVDGKGCIWLLTEDGRVWHGAIGRLKKN